MAKVEDLEEIENSVDIGESVWFLSADGRILKLIWLGLSLDRSHCLLGNEAGVIFELEVDPYPQYCLFPHYRQLRRYLRNKKILERGSFLQKERWI